MSGGTWLDVRTALWGPIKVVETGKKKKIYMCISLSSLLALNPLFVCLLYALDKSLFSLFSFAYFCNWVIFCKRETLGSSRTTWSEPHFFLLFKGKETRGQWAFSHGCNIWGFFSLSPAFLLFFLTHQSTPFNPESMKEEPVCSGS